MRKISRSIQRFVGPLDSARTTHYFSLQEHDERWWIPNSEDAWKEQMILASAVSLEKILRGDIICLPRNQFFDSPGWLNIAYYVTKMKLPTFSICLLNLDPTPRNFIKDITTNILRNPKFALSGWPGLSNEQRILMADNIDNTGSFSKMLKGITVESSLRDDFEMQRDALQCVLEYMAPEKQLENQGFEVIRSVSGYKKSPWERLLSDYKSKEFKKEMFKRHGEVISREYLDHLGDLISQAPKKARADIVQEFGEILSVKDLSINVNQWLNQRTNLYRAISDYPLIVRQLIWEHINDAYEDSLTESVTDTGRQVSVDNGNKNIPYKIRSNQMDLIKGELSEKFVAIPYKSNIDIDTMAQIIYVMNDGLIQKSIENMRKIRTSKEMSVKQIIDTENIHLELLTSRLPVLIVSKSEKSRVVDFTFKMSGYAIEIIGTATLIGAVQVLMDNPSFVKLFLETTAAFAGGKISSPVKAMMLPVKEKIKIWLNDKDSKIIAGRVSEWLNNTKEI